MTDREQLIIDYIKKYGNSSSKEIFDGTGIQISYATLKRELVKLISENFIVTQGRGRGVRYQISPIYEVTRPYDLEEYYQKESDERNIKERFNFSIISDILLNHSILSENELVRLSDLQNKFSINIARLTKNEYNKEIERLAIDLSWKSSQIEGNTYSLLETERLLKEKETTAGKTKDEAIMLLNHKNAIDFIIANPDYLRDVIPSKIADIHSLLVEGLPIDRNFRKGSVGITGTNYRPLDNEYQISEALVEASAMINNKANIFEKALLALVLISYIQPFMDGNKRTARIVCNSILINGNHCPLSFRSVNSIDYKKAMILFYERNNLSAIKNIFIDQYDFAVNTYF